jgi:Ca-activated chloride channel family protein
MGGAQDIALFRSIVAAGGIPGSSTLDPVGFFAEHALDLPESTCGENVCLHPMLAVAPRFDGGNWTMAYVALGSSVDPATLPRPPVHVALTLERTTRTLSQWAAVEAGVRALVNGLRDEDRVSLVVFDEQARVIVRQTSPRGTEIDDALAALTREPRGETFGTTAALYDGIALGAETASSSDGGFVGASRVVLYSTGHAAAGITDRERIVALAESWARMGTSFSVIGGGAEFDPAVVQDVGSIGAGRYSVSTDDADLVAIFMDEGETSMVPLALDFQMVLEPSPGYHVGRIYGARRAFLRSDGTVLLDAPALFLGVREGSHDVGGSRRGGGSGLFVELLADPASGVGPGAAAFRASATYQRPDGSGTAMVDLTIDNELAPGQNPDDMWARVMGAGTDMKPFMMLNMFLALRTTVVLFEDGDCTRARGVFDMMGPSIGGYADRFDDPDIDADAELLRLLRQNLDVQCTPTSPIMPMSFDGGCMVS